ncbi:Bcr/CflA family multidrug efflux MFS transporter [Lacipirellula parvula]|nr:Bcr/CflA family multidrug efflux MFS transporter [Lacipirellula parvula]
MRTTPSSPEQPAATKPTAGGWRLLVLLGLLSAFSPLAIDMYLPAFPQMEHDLAAAPGRVELTLSLFLAGLATGQYVIGPLSDRTGRRAPLLIGCGVYSLAALGCPLAPTVEWLIVLRFVMGFAGAAGLVVSRAVVRDLFDEKRSASVYSLMMMVTGIAPIVAPLIGGFLLGHFTWHAIFWTLAAIGIASGAAVAFDLRESLPPERRLAQPLDAVIRRSVTILADLRFIGYALAIGFSYGALFAYITGSPKIYIDYFETTPQAFSGFFASNAIVLLATAQLNRLLLRRYSPHALLRFAAIVAFVGGVTLVAFTLGNAGFWPFQLTLCICIATLGLIFPNATAAAMAPFGREAGGASAVLGLLQYIIGAFAGAAVGLLSGTTPLAMAATLTACEAGVFAVIFWSERHRQ